jgi:hypothetical protein
VKLNHRTGSRAEVKGRTCRQRKKKNKGRKQRKKYRKE